MCIGKHSMADQVRLEFVEPIDVTDDAIFIAVEPKEESLNLSICCIEACVCQHLAQVVCVDHALARAATEVKCCTRVEVRALAQRSSDLFHCSFGSED